MARSLLGSWVTLCVKHVVMATCRAILGREACAPSDNRQGSLFYKLTCSFAVYFGLFGQTRLSHFNLFLMKTAVDSRWCNRRLWLWAPSLRVVAGLCSWAPEGSPSRGRYRTTSVVCLVIHLRRKGIRSNGMLAGNHLLVPLLNLK